MEFILPSLLAGISLYLGKSKLKAFNSYVSASVYTVLVAQPSTGKSGAMAIITNAIDNVEVYNKIPLENSQQVNAPTIEALISILKEHPEIICIHNYLVFTN